MYAPRGRASAGAGDNGGGAGQILNGHGYRPLSSRMGCWVVEAKKVCRPGRWGLPPGDGDGPRPGPAKSQRSAGTGAGASRAMLAATARASSWRRTSTNVRGTAARPTSPHTHNAALNPPVRAAAGPSPRWAKL